MAASAPIQNTDDLIYFICKAVNYVFSVLLILSIIMVLVSAFLFLTAGGNPERVNTAKKTLLWAIAGIAITLLAKTIVFAILPNFVDDSRKSSDAIAQAFAEGCGW